MTIKPLQLPNPVPMVCPLTQALGKRRSQREFSKKPLDPALLSTLLWSCSGMTSESGLRTVPSAMDCREVSVFVFDKSGVHRYDETTARLLPVQEDDRRADTTLGQDFVKTAPVTLLFALDKTRCQKYPGTAAEKCWYIDVGCMVQAGQLAATALGLASVARASFDEPLVSAILSPDNRYIPAMALTIGYPARCETLGD